MKPVMQTNTNVPGGDCFRACVASILEIPLLDVPHYHETGTDERWWEKFQAWLSSRGMIALYAEAGSLHAIPGYCLMGVRTDPPTHPTNERWMHQVVGICTVDGNTVEVKVVHDPRPEPRRIVKLLDVIWLIRNACPT